MDMQVAKKKLGLKERYAVMTRGLDWTPSYQKMEDIYPYIAYEGIKIHDWDKWEDPFRLTMDAYWKYQAEKERKLYAIIDAFNQNNGHLNVTDARYVNTVKLFISGISPLEYVAHRGFAHAGRAFPGPGPRVACLMQSLDEIRHAQTQALGIGLGVAQRGQLDQSRGSDGDDRGGGFSGEGTHSCEGYRSLAAGEAQARRITSRRNGVSPRSAGSACNASA